MINYLIEQLFSNTTRRINFFSKYGVWVQRDRRSDNASELHRNSHSLPIIEFYL